MKMKLFLGCTLLLMFTSCIKDYVGHADDKVKLTKENYIYEGDLYSFYLSNEIATLENHIKELESISPNDPKYNEAQKEKAMAESQKKEFMEVQKSIFDLGILGIIDPDNPPLPCFCWTLSNLQEFLITTPDTKILNVSVLDLSGKEISKIITEFSPLPEYNNQILYQKFATLAAEKGELLIKVEKLGEDGRPFNYTIPAYYIPQ
ncbi:hypothetical protein [Zobellia russellii]|uniref:hypothetical protein n=1 Tax=Zobellia russellii TaxID=248907 RepID=UPI001BFF866B|nr:hypothetical protein [Zobellia russellii]MBT9187710.1 hypothetical protein [Zobellia russellii]